MIREIYLAGGCYWGTQKFLDSIQGVTKTEVGFANGSVPSPSYEQVKHTETGHAETVHVFYDDSVISLKTLLELFFNIIDPTSTLNSFLIGEAQNLSSSQGSQSQWPAITLSPAE